MEEKREMEMETTQKSISIPNSRKEDFEHLVKMGYDIKSVVEAINNSTSIGFALDILVEKIESLENTTNASNATNNKKQQDQNEIKHDRSNVITVAYV